MQGARLTRRQESAQKGNKLSSSNGQQKEATSIRVEKGEATESAILMTLTTNGLAAGTQEANENESSSSSVGQKEEKPTEIDVPHWIESVAFLTDGEHIVSGGYEGKIRRWQVKDGKEVGTPMDAGSIVWSFAVSRDGKWIVSGTRGGQVRMWNAESHEKVNGFKGHDSSVYAVDVSPDGTKIATGSYDETACVWSLSTGQRLLGPFEHRNWVIAIKFSPDGRLIATATLGRKSVRIYDSQDGRLIVDFPVGLVESFKNQSLAWVSDSKQLFALSHDGHIHRLDVSTHATLFKWPIHGNNRPGCISLASNGTFIAASDYSSVSFWDTVAHKQIGSVIHHAARVESMAISANYDLVTGAGKKIILWNLLDILPCSYFDDVSASASKVRDDGLFITNHFIDGSYSKSGV